MNELQVVVQQEVGKINWNFEELKAAIVEKVQQYTGVIYDDSVIADAKKDVAELRKIKTSIESRRKEAKAKCLEPYEILEGQVKEITKLIDDPIDMIDRQIKDYEKEQKRKRREEILTYMAETFSELPGSLTEKLKAKIYDSRWENALNLRRGTIESIVHRVFIVHIRQGKNPDFTVFRVHFPDIRRKSWLENVLVNG